MKVVDFYELCAMPKGTIFAEWEPATHQALSRLGNVINGNDGKPIDFFYCDVTSFAPNGCGPCVSSIEGRWALYDDSQEFLIWEPEDIERMIRILTSKDTPEDNVWPVEPIYWRTASTSP